MTKSKLRKLLTKPKFRKWLEGKKPRAVVGVPFVGIHCPMGRYLGEDVFSLSTNIYPRWACRFVQQVDESGYIYITASRALHILDGIK